MAYQLKDSIRLLSPHLPVQCIFCFTQTKPCIQPCFSQDKTVMKRSNSKAKSKDVVKAGERHGELPATSPIIPRQISSGRFIKDFYTSMNELLFGQLVRSIKYSYYFSLLLYSCLSLWCRNLILMEPAMA